MKKPKHVLGWTLSEPDLLTPATVDDAKLGYFDKRRKARAELEHARRRQLAAEFHNASGTLR